MIIFFWLMVICISSMEKKSLQILGLFFNLVIFFLDRWIVGVACSGPAPYQILIHDSQLFPPISGAVFLLYSVLGHTKIFVFGKVSFIYFSFGCWCFRCHVYETLARSKVTKNDICFLLSPNTICWKDNFFPHKTLGILVENHLTIDL